MPLDVSSWPTAKPAGPAPRITTCLGEDRATTSAVMHAPHDCSIAPLDYKFQQTHEQIRRHKEIPKLRQLLLRSGLANIQASNTSAIPRDSFRAQCLSGPATMLQRRTAMQ